MRPGTKPFFTLAGVLLALWVGLRFFLPVLFPFLLGAGLALTAEPMTHFLHRQLRVPRAVSAGIGVSMAFACIAMLVLLVCAFVVRELRLLAGVLPDLESAAGAGIASLEGWLLDLAAHAPQSLRPLLSRNVASLFSDGSSLASRVLQYLLSLAGNLLSHVPDSALSLGTALISGYMISAKLPKFRAWTAARFPRERLKPLLDTLKRMKEALLGWITAQLKLAGVTLTILILGFVLLRIPYALLWALGVSLVDAFPILGTGTVLLPWALICLVQGDAARAVGLIGIYTVITLTRSVLEPRLVGRHLGLDPLVTLAALYAGYKLWGIGGMILSPLLAVTAVQLLSPNASDG